jgi:hypothetical protein
MNNIKYKMQCKPECNPFKGLKINSKDSKEEQNFHKMKKEQWLFKKAIFMVMSVAKKPICLFKAQILKIEKVEDIMVNIKQHPCRNDP